MVKCEDCGFLALRNHITGYLDEAPQEYRWRAEIPKLRNPTVKGVQSSAHNFFDYPYTGVATCIVRSHPLHNEFTSQDRATEKEIFDLLVRERNCAKRGLFTHWQQGFTPKEHLEMRDRKRALEREELRDQEMRAWQQSQEQRAEDRHQEQMATARRMHTREMWIIGGAVTVSIALITILGAAIQARWIPQWFGISLGF